MPKKYGVLLDTETVVKNGGASIYDLGYLIIDVQGNVIAQRNFIISELYSDFGLLFDSQFITYNKYNLYKRFLNDNPALFISCEDAFTHLFNDMQEYNISFMAAYNINFDLRAITHTCKLFDIDNQLLDNENIIFLDLWKLAKSFIATNRYNKFCLSNGFLTEKRKLPRTNAETIYRWISKDYSFIEQHTALSDCMIELEIYKTCKRKKKRIPQSAYVMYC